jgi:peptide/nickel transport system ATP-binding protein/oligopeptide transport system ATP-binding protein
MNLGQIVEIADNQSLFSAPGHPYTRALLSAVPIPNPAAKRPPLLLKGEMPSALNPPAGCRFHTRCPFVIDRCWSEPPLLRIAANDHAVACHRMFELPPAEAIASRDGGFLPGVERLLKAFSRTADNRQGRGVDTVEMSSGRRRQI